MCNGAARIMGGIFMAPMALIALGVGWPTTTCTLASATEAQLACTTRACWKTDRPLRHPGGCRAGRAQARPCASWCTRGMRNAAASSAAPTGGVAAVVPSLHGAALGCTAPRAGNGRGPVWPRRRLGLERQTLTAARVTRHTVRQWLRGMTSRKPRTRKRAGLGHGGACRRRQGDHHQNRGMQGVLAPALAEQGTQSGSTAAERCGSRIQRQELVLPQVTAATAGARLQALAHSAMPSSFGRGCDKAAACGEYWRAQGGAMARRLRSEPAHATGLRRSKVPTHDAAGVQRCGQALAGLVSVRAAASTGHGHGIPPDEILQLRRHVDVAGVHRARRHLVALYMYFCNGYAMAGHVYSLYDHRQRRRPPGRSADDAHGRQPAAGAALRAWPFGRTWRAHALHIHEHFADVFMPGLEGVPPCSHSSWRRRRHRQRTASSV